VNPITWVQGLDGTTLLMAICILMFLEETGVPLPFAPGDLVLATAGIAVADGRVNPVLLVSTVAISVTVGALIGRGVAEWLGWNRLMRPPDRSARATGRSGRSLRCRRDRGHDPGLP
jgi:membrane protein DedA with SNARE-associated domain